MQVMGAPSRRFPRGEAGYRRAHLLSRRGEGPRRQMRKQPRKQALDANNVSGHHAVGLTGFKPATT